jgi:23S rRNA pseudouridine1911/1915/1917 synthase
MQPHNAQTANTAPLLDWLLRNYPDTPRTRAKQWIQAGRVTVNGTVCRKPHQIMADPGDSLELSGRNATTLDCGNGWHIHPRVSLLYLDSALAIVNKGPGLISVPASNCTLSALSILADFLSGKLRARDRSVAGKSLPSAYRKLEPLPVHRLDQYTSGVFCIATNPEARHHLIEQLKVHSMKREYVAFVEGRSSAAKGTWRQWLELSRDQMRQLVVTPTQAKAAGDEAQEAITHYEVIAEYPLAGGKGYVTKLRLRLETGRKHQIRVQAANAGLPLIGDRTYNNPAYRERDPEQTSIDFPRQALHAEILSLEHPDQPGRRMSWTAELPKDLRQLEGALRSGHL